MAAFRVDRRERRGLVDDRLHVDRRALACEVISPRALPRDGMSIEKMMERLAKDFGVTLAAMRVRLDQVKLA